MTIKSDLKAIAKNHANALYRHVADTVASMAADGYYDEPKGVFEDISQGLSSGIVSELIYYKDTCAFYEKFKDEIWDLLYSESKEMGCKNIMEFIGQMNGANNVGNEDQFKNLLTWYAFETVAYKLSEGI